MITRFYEKQFRITYDLILLFPRYITISTTRSSNDEMLIERNSVCSLINTRLNNVNEYLFLYLYFDINKRNQISN